MPKTMQAVQAHQPQQFGHDKTPLLGGGCYLYGLAFFRHRASRLGRECSGLMAAREDVGAIFCCRVQSTAKTGAPERARGCDRLPGKGLPWAGAAFCPGAFYAKSASKHCQASASSYFIDSKKPAQQHQDSRQQHSPGHQHRAAHPAGSSAWRHTPGQGLATRTRQARPSLAGQGVALDWCCFACWGA